RLTAMQDSQVDLASQGTGSFSADLLQHIHRVGLDSLHGEFHAHHSLNRTEALRPDLHVGLLLILALTNDGGSRALSQRRDSVLAQDARVRLRQARDDSLPQRVLPALLRQVTRQGILPTCAADE